MCILSAYTERYVLTTNDLNSCRFFKMRTAAVAMLLLLALGAASAQKFRKSDQR